MPENSLTQSELKEFFHYDPATGLFTRIKCAHKRLVGQVTGRRKNGYIYIYFKEREHTAHRLAWLYMTGEFPVSCTDHINHVRDDNRWINLREATYAENSRNRKLNNPSGITGVRWNPTRNKWKAEICFNYKNRHIGYYKTKLAAAYARHVANMKYGLHVKHGT